jgi:hypothetical protein
MFFAIVGIVIAVVLLIAGLSDLRRKRRTGETTRVNDAKVSASVRSARARARAYRRPTYRG